MTSSAPPPASSPKLAPFLPADLHAVIVDLDGTMVDTLGDFAQALNRMLADLALPAIAPQAIQNMVGKGSEHLLQSVLTAVIYGQNQAQTLAGKGQTALKSEASTAVPAMQAQVQDQVQDQVQALLPRAWERYQQHYLTINGQHAQVYPEVLAGLTALRQAGLRLACLTNKPTAFALPLLHAKGLEGFFDHVFGGDAFERKKPDPLPLLRTCAALGSSPARTLMLGDSSNDAQAARAAGCPVVLVSYGYNHGEPVQNAGADAVVDGFLGLWES